MARKQERSKAVRGVKLTEKAYKYFEAEAFKNCRDLWQEVSYRLESQVPGAKKPGPIPHSERYDAGESEPKAVPYSMPVSAELPPLVSTGPVSTVWSPEQEAEVEKAAQEAGVAGARLTALKLIHKTPEAVLEALRAAPV